VIGQAHVLLKIFFIYVLSFYSAINVLITAGTTYTHACTHTNTWANIHKNITTKTNRKEIKNKKRIN
jgi:hypothetical protein